MNKCYYITSVFNEILNNSKIILQNYKNGNKCKYLKKR